MFQLGQFDPDEALRFKLDIEVGDSWNVPIGGSVADSGFFQVSQIGDSSFWSHTFKFANIVAFTPDSSRAFLPEFMLVDSIGIFFVGFEGGKLELQGARINGKQFGTITSVRPIENNPSENTLSFFDNYPNPFNNSTTVEYRLSRSAWVRISIFNVLGERVRVLVDSFQTLGLHRINWLGKNEIGVLVSSGIYFYTIDLDNKPFSKNSLLFFKKS